VHRLIIFSSSEGLTLAQYIQKNLYPKEYAVQLWTNGFFRFSKSFISNFSSMENSFDYAIILLTKDDLIMSRGKKFFIPRDNIIFELGLCIGQFGLDRVFIVKPDDLHLPSDLDGIASCNYVMMNNFEVVAGSVCANLVSYIRQTPVETDKQIIDWNDYCYQTGRLIDFLKQPLALGGFNLDCIIGVNRGGLMTGDLISREYGHNMPILSLFADRRLRQGGIFNSVDAPINNMYLLDILSGNMYSNILVVDSFSRKGRTIVRAKDYLTNLFGNKKIIKSSLVFADNRLKGKNVADYIADYRDLSQVRFSLKP